MSMWFACSACCSTAVKPGQHTDTKKRLNVFYFRCLQSILGDSWHDRIPNTTIMKRTGAPDIFSLLRIYRLRWSGHVCRIEDGRLQKKILYGQITSAPRPVVCPKLRYRDVLKRGLKALNINTENWEHWHWSVLPGAPLCKTDEHIRFKRTSQTAMVAELIVGHDGKGHREERDTSTNKQLLYYRS